MRVVSWAVGWSLQAHSIAVPKPGEGGSAITRIGKFLDGTLNKLLWGGDDSATATSTASAAAGAATSGTAAAAAGAGAAAYGRTAPQIAGPKVALGGAYMEQAQQAHAYQSQVQAMGYNSKWNGSGVSTSAGVYTYSGGYSPAETRPTSGNDINPALAAVTEADPASADAKALPGAAYGSGAEGYRSAAAAHAYGQMGAESGCRQGADTAGQSQTGSQHRRSMSTNDANRQQPFFFNQQQGTQEASLSLTVVAVCLALFDCPCRKQAQAHSTAPTCN